MDLDYLLKFTNFIIISKTKIFILVFLLLISCISPLSISTSIEKSYKNSSFITEGHILFSPMYGTNTYLVDTNGYVNHTWSSIFLPGVSVLWLGDRRILRSIRVGVGPGSGGAGGGVQKIESDGAISWDFRYNTGGVLSHHDIKMLPNGNVLMIAWEDKTRNEAINEGRNPNFVNFNGLSPDHIIEVKPTGPTSGDIVWEWHVWDHLIQDYDPSKNNYGVVEDHPELVDINYVTSLNPDLMHTNSIDYNEEFDQIMISVHNYNEIWIIDHSTTTAEAAGHLGGTSGMGGDLLYRWGNPEAYGTGSLNDRKFFGQHDATWIKPGYPGEGNILVFNNGIGRWYSSVDEIIPPVDEYGNYYLEPGTAYGPANQTWIYTADPVSSFFANHVSGAYRLSNGNTLICHGGHGEVFEVTSDGTTVWQYTNPYPNPATNDIFKVVYIPQDEPPNPEIPDLECSGSLIWTDITPGATIMGSFKVKNVGGNSSLLNWTINTSSINWGQWTFNPESGNLLSTLDGEISILASVVVPSEKNSEFEGFIRVENKNDTEDFELIPASLTTALNYQSYKGFFDFILQKIFNYLEKHVQNLLLFNNFT